jgi:hypothetical protein
MRTYILNWMLGVKRCYWYAWDNHNWSTLDVTSQSDNQMNEVGAAYGVIERWLVGAVLRGCERNRSGLWTCQIERGNAIGRLVWSDSGDQELTLPVSWAVRTLSTWVNHTEAAPPRITISDAPILLTSN